MIFKDGCNFYHTPQNIRVPLLAKLFPSLYFYSTVIRIVFDAGRIAQAGRYDDQQWIKSSLDTLHKIERVGGSISISGFDILRRLGEPVVFIANHMSTLETFVLPGIISPFIRTTFVVKRSLLHQPYFGAVLATRKPIVVERKNPREDLVTVLEQGHVILKSGISVIVFPQATRNPRFNPDDMNTLGVKLAKKADVAIVPVALKTDFWGTGRLLRDFGKIRVSQKIHITFGEPSRIEGSGKENNESIKTFIMSHLQQWCADVTDVKKGVCGNP
ncbi:MAG: 1-acyl-sn-glycerol-3-phosphate acyltransferase [Chitinivibrionales bacterium]|nr:1-acyl-sn-glycerol-3-phosphate acyltransferase [Chitinivibrionales bacterium]